MQCPQFQILLEFDMTHVQFNFLKGMKLYILYEY